MAKNKIERIDQEIAKKMCIRDRGYTVLLCFTLFKTGSLSKAVFNAH